MPQTVLSISQLNEYIRGRMDADSVLSQVAVKGEISNYKIYPSGHHYFTLKDEQASLKCVMFKGNAIRMRFRLENGMKIIAIGKVTVYPRDGAYQLYCTAITADGVGDLYTAFEQLKKKLAAQGIFDQAHKRPIPKYPEHIALITSPAGAAVHDMLRIIRKRYPLTKIRILPVRVQGREAPEEIANAISYANHFKLADLLIVGRGGGSIEDLWAFNDERVAYAIFNSRIPVISAVGHEPDVVISDYVADLRAATPSNAAELAVPDQNALRQSLDVMVETMTNALEHYLKNAQNHLYILSRSPSLQSPVGYLNLKTQDLEIMMRRLIVSQSQNIERKNARYVAAISKLDAMSPLKVLSRGYSMVLTEKGEVLRNSSQVELGERITVTLSNGKLSATVMNKENSA